MAQQPANTWGSFQSPSSYITVKNDYTDTASGQSYKAGEQVDATDWDKDQIKSFRDATGGSDFYSDDITKQFDQYAIDNLDGISQYEFQLNGTRDQWADMITTPELNRFWQAYGVNEGDRDSAVNFYNYYSGTDHDAEGNVIKYGQGKNQLANMDPYGNPEDFTDIVGGSASAAAAFNEGFLKDRQPVANGGIALDGVFDNEISDSDLALFNLQTFEGLTKTASDAGTLGDKPTDGRLDEGQRAIYDSISDARPRTKFEETLGEPNFINRELGTFYYDEPNIDPDIRLRDVYSLDDLTNMGAAAGMIDRTGIPDEAGNIADPIPTWAPASGRTEATLPIEYTEGSLTNPYIDENVTRESFDSALALFGDGDIRKAPMADLNEDGSFKGYTVGTPWAERQEREDLDDPNISPNGVLLNSLGEDGSTNISLEPNDIFDYHLGGSNSSAFDSPYTDEFLAKNIREGGALAGPLVEGWRPTSEIALENDWNGDDYRVFAEAAKNENALSQPLQEPNSRVPYMPGVSGDGNINNYEATEQNAIDAVNRARQDRNLGIEADPFIYNGNFLNNLNPEAQDAAVRRSMINNYGAPRSSYDYNWGEPEGNSGGTYLPEIQSRRPFANGQGEGRTIVEMDGAVRGFNNPPIMSYDEYRRNQWN